MTTEEMQEQLGRLGDCLGISPTPEVPPGITAAVIDLVVHGLVRPLNQALRRGEPRSLDNAIVKFEIHPSGHCELATIALSESVEVKLSLQDYAAHVPGPTGFELNPIRLEHVREATWRRKNAEAAK